MDIDIRPAKEEDRLAIAGCIAEGFERDFSIFSKDISKTIHAIAGGIQTERFYVAVIAQEVAGVIGLSDCRGRAVRTDKAAYRRHWGPLKGSLAYWILKKEFESRLPYPSSTGFLEFAAVREKFRRQRIASSLLKECMRQANYQEYVLDVVAANTPAMNCYLKLGFKEFHRAKKSNKHVHIYMKRSNKNS